MLWVRSDNLNCTQVEIGQSAGQIVVRKELITVKNGIGYVESFLSFANGIGQVLNIIPSDDPQLLPIKKQEEEQLKSPDILAVQALSNFKKNNTVSLISYQLAELFIVDFDVKILRLPSVKSEHTFLFSDGSNLAHIAKNLYDYRRVDFDKILAKLPKHIPAIYQVEALKTEDGRIILKFQDKHFRDPFETQNVSNGTMKFFAYLVLLSGYYPSRLLCLEEPEKDFHPQIMPYLVDEIRQNAEQRSAQVFVSTHSPEFVDSVQLDELFYMVKQDGFSTIRAAADDPVVCELAKDNSLGWLWRNNYLQANSL